VVDVGGVKVGVGKRVRRRRRPGEKIVYRCAMSSVQRRVGVLHPKKEFAVGIEDVKVVDSSSCCVKGNPLKRGLAGVHRHIQNNLICSAVTPNKLKEVIVNL
jgi:hypothetical protein